MSNRMTEADAEVILAGVRWTNNMVTEIISSYNRKMTAAEMTQARTIASALVELDNLIRSRGFGEG